MTGTAAATDWTAVAAVLRHAMRLCAQGWCQKAFAETAAGLDVASSDPEAARWCPEGAVNRAGWELRVPHEVWMAAQIELERGLPGRLVLWNDAPGRTQDEVIAHFAVSISRLEAKHGIG